MAVEALSAIQIVELLQITISPVENSKGMGLYVMILTVSESDFKTITSEPETLPHKPEPVILSLPGKTKR